MTIKDKLVVITGATSGIGWQTALDFSKQGACVIGVGRNPQRCTEAREKILALVPGAQIQYLIAVLSSQTQVRDLATQTLKILEEKSGGRLDVLVNVAGIYAGKKTFTDEGIEKTFAVNHLAPFLLSTLLLPALVKSGSGRVITVSSDSHYNTLLFPERAKAPIFFFGLLAYKASKLCNVLFSYEFNQLNGWHFPHAFAVDPGLVNTEIGLKDTGLLAGLVWKFRKNLGVSPQEPSNTILFLADDAGAVNSRDIYWHDSQPKTPSRNATDPNLSKRLWNESCSLTGISNPYGGNHGH